MQKLLLFLILSCSLNTSIAQNTNAKLKDIQDNYRNFSQYSNQRDDYDSLFFYEHAFFNSLKSELEKKFKSTFKQLPQLFKDGNPITLLSSNDGKLNFICWDDQSGGTMRNTSCIVAYESNGKYIIENFYKEHENEEGSFNPFIRELHQVQGQTGPIYLIFDLFIGSSALYYPSCKTLTIENGLLNKNAKYIKTQSGLNNSISYEIDFTRKFYRENNNISRNEIDFLFHFAPKIQAFHFPVVLESGEITKKRIYYQFDGQYFIKKKIQ